MLKVGLTGGIGCGKSTVCEIFRALGAPIIDTDELAREVVAAPSPVLAQIRQFFGDGVLQDNGTLDRSKLRQIVFNDPTKRQWLETITHPAIRSLLHERIARLNSPYVIIAIPLLIEKAWQGEVDRILVVDCTETLQLKRTMSRDSSEEKLIQSIINSQVSRNKRLEEADDIIHNDADLESLRIQVENLHKYYTNIVSNS